MVWCLACLNYQRNLGWLTHEDAAAEGKQYVSRAIEVGVDDADALSRSAAFLGVILRDVKTADLIADQGNCSEFKFFLGLERPRLDQHFLGSARALPSNNSITPCGSIRSIRKSSVSRPDWHGPIFFNVVTRLPHRGLPKRYPRNSTGPSIMIAMLSCAMLGRIADAQGMLTSRREAGIVVTISQVRKRNAHFRKEDVELIVEACRVLGVPE